MNAAVSQFVKRAGIIIQALQQNTFPNKNSLAKILGCSKNTAQRAVYRLRDEYCIPIEYNPSEKGYYLTKKDFAFPSVLPPGKDELSALLILRSMADMLGAPDLSSCLDKLWAEFTAINPRLSTELTSVMKFFSCDSTSIGKISDQGLLEYVNTAAQGENLKITYQSPWRHDNEKIYLGRILRVHINDSNVYILFRQESGREFVLNASFIKKFEILNYDLRFTPSSTELVHLNQASHWLEGFGIWSGEEMTQVEVQILPPAAKYYAQQLWDDNQEDCWNGDILVRTFPCIVSPEIVRRILSLGQYVTDVQPLKLKELVVANARAMISGLT